MNDYPFTIRKLSQNEGGGYLAQTLDLSGCITDSETIEKAIDQLQDAILSWIKTEHDLGYSIPPPSTNATLYKKQVTTIPITPLSNTAYSFDCYWLQNHSKIDT